MVTNFLPWESNCLFIVSIAVEILCGGDSQTQRLERIAGDIVLWKWGFVPKKSCPIRTAFI
jgi:hypothetical protein